MVTFLMTIIAAGVGAYLSTYLREKGKNLATKEDLGELTRIVEEIKNEHAKELELLKSRQQMRMASIDRRLQAHQEAFALWRRLYKDVHTERVGETIGECERWWSNNCLYLEHEAREAFSDAWWAASHHKGYLDIPIRNETALANITRNWEKIEKAGNVILEAAKLPGLSSSEQERIKENPFGSGQAGRARATSEDR